MEFVKKTIKQETTVESVSENEVIVVPDENAVYSLKLLLTKKEIDLGFFDTVESLNQNLE